MKLLLLSLLLVVAALLTSSFSSSSSSSSTTAITILNRNENNVNVEELDQFRNFATSLSLSNSDNDKKADDKRPTGTNSDSEPRTSASVGADPVSTEGDLLRAAKLRLKRTADDNGDDDGDGDAESCSIPLGTEASAFAPRNDKETTLGRSGNGGNGGGSGIVDEAVILCDIWQDVLSKGTGAGFVGEECSDEMAASFYKDLCVQFEEPLNRNISFTTRIMPRRSKWLDRDVILMMRGVANIVQHPELFPVASITSTTRLSKGIYLKCTDSNSEMQSMIVSALCYSTNATLVTLDRNSFDSVRRLALARGLARKGLARPKLLTAFFQAVEKCYGTSCPVTIYLPDNANFLFSSQGCCELFLQRVRNRTDKVFFVVSSTTAIDNAVKSDSPKTSQGQFQSQPQQQISPPEDIDQNMNMPFPFPFPPPPSGFPPTLSQVFQVSQQNGSTTMEPVGPAQASSSMPFPPMRGSDMTSQFPRGAQFPSPPDAMMKRIIAEHQKKLQQRRESPNKIPDVEADARSFHEAMQELMTDPESGPQIKEFLDKLVNSMSQSLPPEKFKEIQEAMKDGKLSMRVDMMQLPMGVAMGLGLGTTNGPAPPGAVVVPQKFFNSVQGQNQPKQNPQAGHSLSSVNEKKLSTTATTFLQSLQSVSISAPSDVHLKSRWQQLCVKQRERSFFQANKKVLSTEFKRLDLTCRDELFMLMEDSLSTCVIPKEEARRIAIDALKMQAGTVSVHDAPMHSISVWAFEIALGDAIKRLGSYPTSSLISQSGFKPLMRSKEDLLNIVTDKQERNLVSNIIFPQDIGVSYDMIGGLDSVKELLRQSVTYPLKYPRFYREGIAAESVKGVLLFGPPGTGKTMLAKAVATEGCATFICIDASTIESKWLGESEKNAKAVFTLARRLAPSVIYLDEVDSILSSREHGDDSSHGTLTSVKTTLMQEWDGLQSSKDRVIVIASTNRPFDLDEAVLRRLPRRILVDLPDLRTREDILRVTLRNNRVSPTVNLTKIAEKLEGYTGSDIKEVCREAVVHISHERAHLIEKLDLTSEYVDDLFSDVREVSDTDFQTAMKKLKASVDTSGREMSKVIEWNEKFGEYRKINSRKSKLGFSMYI